MERIEVKENKRGGTVDDSTPWEEMTIIRLMRRQHKVIDRKWTKYDRELRLWEMACIRLHDAANDPALQRTLLEVEKMLDKEKFSRKNLLQRSEFVSWWDHNKDKNRMFSAPFIQAVTALIAAKPGDEKFAISLYAIGSLGIEPQILADLFRDVFPQYPIHWNPQWNTSTVTALAKGIYDDALHDHLPILADALQDAGCDDDEMLNHCRRDKPHTRGCWVIDNILQLRSNR